MQFHLQLHELSDVCVRYRSSFTINYRALFPDECLGKRKAIRSTPVGVDVSSGPETIEWTFWKRVLSRMQWFGSLGGRDFIWRRVPPVWIPFGCQAIYFCGGSCMVLLWELPRCSWHSRDAVWVWDMQAGCGVGRFVRSMATNSSLARRQMQIDFLKWTPTPDPIEWHRRRPVNTHCLDLSSEANVWCALIVMSGIRCQRWNQAMQCAEDLQRAWSELCALLERSSAAEIASGACTLCIVHWHKRDESLGCYSRHHAYPWGGFVWICLDVDYRDDHGRLMCSNDRARVPR